MAPLLNLFCFRKNWKLMCYPKLLPHWTISHFQKKMTPKSTAFEHWQAQLGGRALTIVGWILQATQMQVMMVDMTCTPVGDLSWELIDFQMESHLITSSTFHGTCHDGLVTKLNIMARVTWCDMWHHDLTINMVYCSGVATCVQSLCVGSTLMIGFK